MCLDPRAPGARERGSESASLHSASRRSTRGGYAGAGRARRRRRRGRAGGPSLKTEAGDQRPSDQHGAAQVRRLCFILCDLSYRQVSGWCSSHACSSDGKGIILSSSFGVVGRKSLCQRSSSRYVCLSVSVGARGLCKLTRTILSSHARRPDMHADRTSWATSCDMQTRSMLRHAVTCQHTRTEML